MTTTVWKYPLRDSLGGMAPTTLRVPVGGVVVGVGADPDREPAVWILIDTSAPVVERTFIVTGTGAIAPSGGQHCGLMVNVLGPFVWHVWDMGEARPHGEIELP